MKKNLYFIIIAILFLGGCVKQKNLLRDAYVNLSAVSRAVLPAGSPETLVNLPAGTSVGLYIPSAGESLTSTPRSNLEYTAAPDGSLIGDPLVLGMSGNYNVYAYSPRRSVVADPSAVEFFHGEDALWATAPLNDIPAGIVNAELLFEHKMSQVSFNVVYSSDLTPEEVENYPISGAVIEVSGFYDNCFLDIATGAITLGTETNAKVTQLNTPVNFISPQGSALLLTATVTIPGDGEPLVFTGAIVQTFEPNTSYAITVIFGVVKTTVTINGAVVPWIDGGTQTEVVQ